MLLADTITKLGPEAAGAVIVSGSHGGRYPGYLARRAGARAVIFNDAAVGKDDAGIGSLPLGEKLAMAAATVGFDSARIGDTADMLARGVISHANQLARNCGCQPGISCTEAARALQAAPLSAHSVDSEQFGETRTVLDSSEQGPLRLILIDSASLLAPEDSGQIVITGSHGGLIGGDPALALRAGINPLAALFNDAGGGAGITRLPALDQRGIAAATVAASSACIGNAQSSYQHGTLSTVNQTAARLGATPGLRADDFVALLQRHSDHQPPIA